MLKSSLSVFFISVNLSVAADKITYDDHIFPIFESKCLNCHNPDKKKGDLDLSTYTGSSVWTATVNSFEEPPSPESAIFPPELPAIVPV